jgi:energy-coupling factor transporter ATP-binding protein EcfA2
MAWGRSLLQIFLQVNEMIATTNFFVNSDELSSAIELSGIIELPDFSTIIQAGNKPVMVRWYIAKRRCGWLMISADGKLAIWGDLRNGRGYMDKATTANMKTKAEFKRQADMLLRQAHRIFDEESALIAKKAAEIFAAAQEDATHPYLASKGLQAGPTRVRKETLLVPCYANKSGNLQALQRIDATGTTMSPIGFIAGTHLALGNLASVQTHLVCADFATGQMIHAASGIPVAVVFDTRNFIAYAQHVSEAASPASVIICLPNAAIDVAHANAACRLLSSATVLVPGSKYDTFEALLAAEGVDAVGKLVRHETGRLEQMGAEALKLDKLGIDVIGLNEGLPSIYVRETGTTTTVGKRPDSLARIGMQRLRALAFNDEKGEIDYDKAFEILQTACAYNRETSTMDMRGVGIWRKTESAGLLLSDGTKVIKDGRALYAPTKRKSIFITPIDPMGVRDDALRLFSEIEKSYDTHAATVIIGWLVQAMAAGCYDWITHIWLTGERGAGKSTVLKALAGILGDGALLMSANSTMPGVRQSVDGSTKPVLIEEGEHKTKSNHKKAIENILELARAASSGVDTNLGGQDGQTGISLKMHNAFCFASIVPGSAGAADDSRMIKVELKKPTYKSRLIKTQSPWLRTFGQKLAGAILADYEALDASILDTIASESLDGSDDRRGDTIGTVLGAARWITGNDTLMIDNDRVAAQFDSNDSTALLENILALKVRGEDGDVTVGRLLEDGSVASMPKDKGLTIVERRGEAPALFIANNSLDLSNLLGVENGAWKTLLLRLPDCTVSEGVANLNGRTQRGLLIPLNDVLSKDTPEIEDAPMSAVVISLKPTAQDHNRPGVSIDVVAQGHVMNAEAPVKPIPGDKSLKPFAPTGTYYPPKPIVPPPPPTMAERIKADLALSRRTSP